MKNRKPNGKVEETNGSAESINQKSKVMMKKKNRTRMGGGRGGLSLEAFANAKTKNDHYNPALLKKQREFYKNAKYVSKYKKLQKRQSQQHDLPSSSARSMEDGNEDGKASERNPGKRKNEKNAAYSLKGLYEKKQEEEEKARLEREAQTHARKEEREKSQTRRKALRDKMFKKTKSGQPVMKYRIEHILQTLQGSDS